MLPTGESGGSYIAYVFAEVEGFSAFQATQGSIQTITERM